MSDLEMRVKDIETLLKGGKNQNRWSLAEIQEIIDRTDFTTDMDNLPLMEIAERLNLAEGNILNLQGSHRSHTNYDPTEFENMHGYKIEGLKKLKGPADSQPVSEYVTPDPLRTLDALLVEGPLLLVAVLWTILAVMTKLGFIGLIGLAILYRRYAKKTEVEV